MKEVNAALPSVAARARRDCDEPGFRVEKWNGEQTELRELSAITGSRSIAFAAFYAAIQESPDSWVVLVSEGNIVAHSKAAPGVVAQGGATMLCGADAPKAQNGSVLTEREREVLSLLLRGMSMKAVGRILGITARTVAFHKYRAMEMNGLRSNVDLVEFGRREGLLTTSVWRAMPWRQVPDAKLPRSAPMSAFQFNARQPGHTAVGDHIRSVTNGQ